MKTNHNSVRFLCVTAMMTALVYVMTAIPRIPIPLGYAHLGDAAIVLIVLFVGKREGIWSAAIGSALSDLLGGFPLWIVPTVIIKAVMAIIIIRIAFDKNGECKLFSARCMIAIVLSMLWMALGYTIGGAILYGGLLVGLSSTPGLLLEGLVNLVVAYVAGAVMEKAQVRRLLHYSA